MGSSATPLRTSCLLDLSQALVRTLDCADIQPKPDTVMLGSKIIPQGTFDRIAYYLFLTHHPSMLPADGCGGYCSPPDLEGECPWSNNVQQICDYDNGTCCRPDCANRQCGDDGCGGSVRVALIQCRLLVLPYGTGSRP